MNSYKVVCQMELDVRQRKLLVIYLMVPLILALNSLEMVKNVLEWAIVLQDPAQIIITLQITKIVIIIIQNVDF